MKIGDKLIICNTEYEYLTHKGHYLKNVNYGIYNDSMFLYLGIVEDRGDDFKFKFVENIVGYNIEVIDYIGYSHDGIFPTVKTRDDLIKVINVFKEIESIGNYKAYVRAERLKELQKLKE